MNTCTHVILFAALATTVYSAPILAQEFDPSFYAAADVAGAGVNLIGEPAPSLLYMRRLAAGRLGLGAELGLQGFAPQLQFRSESPFPAFTAHPPTQVRYGSLGVLLSPGGFEYAGNEVSGGSAAMVTMGGQLWPNKDDAIPLFMDLAVGAAAALSGMEDMPAIAPFVRGYIGFGW